MTGRSMRVGLIADTHVPEAADRIPSAVLDALRGCDRILHAGDLHTLAVVEQLQSIAPTLVSRGNGDTASATRPGVAADARVVDRAVLTLAGWRVGMTHDLEMVEGMADDDADAYLARCFGGRVDIAVSGHTHVPMLRGLGAGTVLVNPGSPLMPYGYLGVTGTVAHLDIDADGFVIQIVDVAAGRATHAVRGPGPHPLVRGERPLGGR